MQKGIAISDCHFATSRYHFNRRLKTLLWLFRVVVSLFDMYHIHKVKRQGEMGHNYLFFSQKNKYHVKYRARLSLRDTKFTQTKTNWNSWFAHLNEKEQQQLKSRIDTFFFLFSLELNELGFTTMNVGRMYRHNKARVGVVIYFVCGSHFENHLLHKTNCTVCTEIRSQYQPKKQWSSEIPYIWFQKFSLSHPKQTLIYNHCKMNGNVLFNVWRMLISGP